MNLIDTQLICIKNTESNTFTVFPKNMTGIIVEVDDLKDAPKKLAETYKLFLEYGFEKGVHKITELDFNKTNFKINN